MHTFIINLILVTIFFVNTKVRINGQIVVADGPNGSDGATDGPNGSDDTADDRNGSDDALNCSIDVHQMKNSI